MQAGQDDRVRVSSGAFGAGRGVLGVIGNGWAEAAKDADALRETLDSGFVRRKD
jgi:hypothetical protein